MTTIAVVIIALIVLIYYGFMKSLETGANIANREIAHLDDVHMVAITKRTANLQQDLDDETFKQAEEVKEKLKQMRKL